MVCDHGKDILGCFVVCLLDPRSAPYTYIVSSDIPYLGLLKAPLFCFFLWGKGVLSSWSVNLSKSFVSDGAWRLEDEDQYSPGSTFTGSLVDTSHLLFSLRLMIGKPS